MSRTDTHPRPEERTGSRWFRVVLLALIPVLILAGGGAYLLSRHTAADHRQAEAELALRAYLTSWVKNDYAAMAAHADASAATIAAVDAPVKRNLQVSAAAYTPGALVRDATGDIGTAPFSARLRLTDLGVWTYRDSLRLIKTKDAAKRDVWRVHFGPTAVVPGLIAGRSLVRTHLSASRGQLLDADGIPLRGQDGDIDGNLLGVVGPLTADQAKAAGPNFVAGDIAGQSGIERAYNPELAGKAGGAIRLMQGAITVSNLATFPATPGRDVKTTVDLRVQRAGETALAAVGPTAALVAIDTRTGGVLAAVNHPSGGYGNAVRGNFSPGSTFKVVTATAALLAGKTETTPLNCPPTLVIAGFPFKNSGGESFGPINLRKAFAVSCNTAFVNLRESLTEADMKRAAQLYGFDGSEPLPIKSFGGSYPVPSGPIDVAASAFGQAAVEASPLQMASVAAAVASSKWRQPFVVGQTSVTHAIPAAVDASLKDMMRAVLTDPNGTAAGVVFPGIVYGKTGTAEFGSGTTLPTHAWFIGFRGSVAFCVYVDVGSSGASVAAPIASTFLNALGPT